MAARRGFLQRAGDAVNALFGRSYEAAEVPRRPIDPDRRYRDWEPLGGGSVVPANLPRRSADRCRNDGYYQQGCFSWRDTLVGGGFIVSPKNATLKTSWLAYAANFMWSGDGTFDTFVGDMVLAMVRDGEALAVVQPDGRWQQLPRSAIEDIDADLSDGRVIRQGIELDHGREEAIHIRQPDFKTERLDRSRYVRIWRRDFPDQVRGAPWGSSVLLATETLSDIERAMTEAVKTSALLSVILVDEADFSGGTPFPGETRDGVQDASLEPGALVKLGAGLRPHIVAPAQSQQAMDLAKHELRRIAAGFGLPVHMVSGDLGDANYSSLRSGQLSLNARAEALQYGLIIPSLIVPVWRRFVMLRFLAGEVTSMDEEADFIAPRPGAVDPQKDMAAVAEMLRLGLTSRKRAISELGWNIDDIDSEIAQDQFRAEPTTGLSEKENSNA